MTIVLTAGGIALIGADHAPAAKVKKAVTLTLAGSFVNDGSTIEVEVPRLTDSGTADWNGELDTIGPGDPAHALPIRVSAAILALGRCPKSSFSM